LSVDVASAGSTKPGKGAFTPIAAGFLLETPQRPLQPFLHSGTRLGAALDCIQDSAQAKRVIY